MSGCDGIAELNAAGYANGLADPLPTQFGQATLLVNQPQFLCTVAAAILLACIDGERPVTRRMKSDARRCQPRSPIPDDQLVDSRK